MKIAAWIGASILLILTLLVVLQIVASERVEVVELHTLDTDGNTVVTRLWVVDHDGSSYLRSGSDGSSWYQRIKANPEVKLIRDEKTLVRHAVPRPEKSELINELMQAKYTWGDTLISLLMGSREGAIAIELQRPSTGG